MACTASPLRVNCSATPTYWPPWALNPWTIMTTPRGVPAGRQERAWSWRPAEPSSFPSHISLNKVWVMAASMGIGAQVHRSSGNTSGPATARARPRRPWAIVASHQNVARMAVEIEADRAVAVAADVAERAHGRGHVDPAHALENGPGVRGRPQAALDLVQLGEQLGPARMHRAHDRGRAQGPTVNHRAC